LLRNYRALMIMACAAIFSATNWGIFLWAVTHGKATEASLGYFLLPLLNVVIGLTLFHESIDFPQKLAVAFALMGLVVQLVYYGGLPLVSLGLAFSFGLYGTVRKAVSIGSVEGLFIELLIMAPIAIAWLVYRDGGGMGQYGLKIDMLLVGSSLVTAIPLMCYVAASRLIPLTALGLVFYIGPTTQLLIAVFVFDEVFSNVQFISFGLVWVGLILMIAANVRRSGLRARIVKQ
jgi:chloramphenicol-sensitive protein RarD